MVGEPGLAPGSPSGLGLRPNVLRGLRLAAAVPGLSTKGAAALLVGCLVLAAIMFPVLLRWPRWIEFEIVIAAWWVIWAVALTYLLYSGRSLIDDFRTDRFGPLRMRPAGEAPPGRATADAPNALSVAARPETAPIDWTIDQLAIPAAGLAAVGPLPGASEVAAPADARRRDPRHRDATPPDGGSPELDLSYIPINIDLPTSIDLPDVRLPEIHLPDVHLPQIDLPDVKLPDIDLGGGGDGDGIVGLLVAIVVAVLIAAVLAVIAFVAVQVVIPALAIGTYALIRAMLLRVQRDAGASAGNLRASLPRGLFWATVYTTPLAVAVWLGHVLL